MPLKIVKGPPNSGRTELIRHAYLDSLHRDPVLVVPSTDDIFTWEERLTRERSAFLGGKVVHFRDLIRVILDRDPNDRHGLAGPLRRRALAREALRRGWPEIAIRMDRQPGLVDATLSAVDELRSELLDVVTFRSRVENQERQTDGESVLDKIGKVYAAFVDLLNEAGLDDESSLAESALATLAGSPGTWESRPVFVAGFDDLTEVQLRILVRLGEITDVTVAITHEEDSPAMAVADLLLARLVDVGQVETSLDRLPDGETGRNPWLNRVEARFLRSDPDPSTESPTSTEAVVRTSAELVATDVITLIESSGTRGEAEAVGAEIARLVAEGTVPDQIAIAVSSPAAAGGVFRDVLREYDIPATLECETPALESVVGQTVTDLLEAVGPGGSAAALVRFLRGPVLVDPDHVDLTEYRLVRAGLTRADQAAAVFRQVSECPVPWWSEVQRDDPGEAVIELTRSLTELILSGRSDRLPGADIATETQMATAIQRAIGELREIHGQGSPPKAAAILEAIRGGAVSTWAIPTGNTVRIASPYSLRAKRFEHLFMVALQETDPGAGDAGGGPLLNRGIRDALGIPQPNDAEDQERYLFHSCLSVPTRRLYLSARIADENGRAEYPSPLIAAVIDTLPDHSGENDSAQGSGPGLRRIHRTGNNIVFPAAAAPSRIELTRSLTAAVGSSLGEPVTETLAAYSPIGRELLEPATEAIERACQTELQTRQLASMTDETVLESLRSKVNFSPTALEAFTGCPYRWYIERGLAPQRFGPEPEAIARGNVIHETLHRLFADRPGRRPTAEDRDEWLAAVAPAIETAAATIGLSVDNLSADQRIMLRRAAADVRAQISREAAQQAIFTPELLEWGFSLDLASLSEQQLDYLGLTDAQRPEWALHGKIDRIDTSAKVGAVQRGVVIDYKSGGGGVKSWVNTLKEHRLQLQLYLAAIKLELGISPVAGLYAAINHKGDRPRGPIDEPQLGDLAYMDVYKEDTTEIQTAIQDAVWLADEAVDRIRRGDIAHDPLSCPNHFHHPAVPDWIPDRDDGENR